MNLRCSICCLLLLGCSSQVELSVELKTDFVPGVEFSGVRVLVDGRVEEVPVFANELFSGRKQVANFTNLSSKSDRLTRVELITPQGEVIAKRTALVKNVRSSQVSVIISRSCREANCAEGTTCAGGMCVPVDCILGGDASCPEIECSTVVDCASATESCLEASCERGVCLYNQRPSSCEEGRFCSPNGGCTSIALPCGTSCMDEDPCTVDRCIGVKCENSPAADGTACDNGSCQSGTCIAFTCADGIRNQDESDIDCGGACSPCEVGGSCQFGTDCESVVCAGTCQSPTCSDGVANNGEMFADCDGPCDPCGPCDGVTSIPRAECDALVDLYQSTDGPTWFSSTRWLETLEPCSWFGVSCVEGHVRGINLPYNRMTGPIPASISNLAQLTSLNLEHNELNGELPTTLGDLSDLELLWLQVNNIRGSIPPEFGMLNSLQYLRLTGNQLTGEIPDTLVGLDQLRHLYLHNNELTGSIPAWLGDLTELTVIVLGGNMLSGTIPDSLGSLPNLQALYVDRNMLTGSIPSPLGDLSATLIDLRMQQNDLTGPIPPSLGNLNKLRFFYLNNNSLTGSIPTELGNLVDATVFVLSNNRLSGSIPASLGSLSACDSFFLNNNDLTGLVPSSLQNIPAADIFQISQRTCLTASATDRIWLDQRDANWNQGCP